MASFHPKQGGIAMSTLDTARQFFLNRRPHAATKKQFLEELQISRKQHENGQSQEASEALAELREKYGL